MTYTRIKIFVYFLNKLYIFTLDIVLIDRDILCWGGFTNEDNK